MVDIWSCVAGPRKSEIRWRTKKFVFIKYRVQVRHTWTNLKKNKADTQPFDTSLPIYLVKKDDGAVALEFAKTYLKIEGQHPDAILKPANAGINKNAHNAIQSVIDLAKLKAVLPGEIQKLNMSIVSARFRDYGGHAIAEINLAANIAEGSTIQLPE